MNVLEMAKKRKEEEAARVAAETAEANRIMMEAKANAPGSVSAGIMGSGSVFSDNQGAGDKPSEDVKRDDSVEHIVDHTIGGPQDVAAGVRLANGIEEDPGEGMAIDPTTRQKFHMPNPLLVREVVPEPELKVGPPGSFRSLRLKRFFGQDGSKIEPNEEGFFIPKNQWEFDELVNYERQYGMVEYQGD